MKIDDARRLLDLLFAAFPSPVLDEGSIEVYLAHLCALSQPKGEATVKRLIATQTFLPKIAEIVAAAGITDATYTDRDGRGVNAVSQLIAAMQRGEELVGDLDSITGWSVGTAARPIPPPLPEPPALPLGPPISAERRLQLRGMVESLANGHRAGGES